MSQLLKIQEQVTNVKSFPYDCCQFVSLEPTSPDLNPTEHLCIVVEQEIGIVVSQPSNLQQLCDVRGMFTEC